MSLDWKLIKTNLSPISQSAICPACQTSEVWLYLRKNGEGQTKCRYCWTGEGRPAPAPEPVTQPPKPVVQPGIPSQDHNGSGIPEPALPQPVDVTLAPDMAMQARQTIDHLDRATRHLREAQATAPAGFKPKVNVLTTTAQNLASEIAKAGGLPA